MHTGKLSDESISFIFRDAADFMRRRLCCGEHTLYAYAIDGLIASAYASDYIFKPITEHLTAPTMEALYQNALDGMIYNNVAKPCEDLDTVALLLVNGFCVVLFPEVGALAFEVRTPDSGVLPHRKLRIPSKAQRMRLWRLSAPTPAMSGDTCAAPICGSMKPRWADGH